MSDTVGHCILVLVFVVAEGMDPGRLGRLSAALVAGQIEAGSRSSGPVAPDERRSFVAEEVGGSRRKTGSAWMVPPAGTVEGP